MKDRKGFTLIEILVSLAAFSLVMVSMGSAFYRIYNDWQRQRDYNLVLENGRWAMEFMSNDIRLGYGDYSFANSGETSEGLADFQFLSFETPPVDTGNNEKIYYWKELDPQGQLVLYRMNRQLTGGSKQGRQNGKDNSKSFSWYKANGLVRELCRFVVDDGVDTFTISSCDASGNCMVEIRLTVRPRPLQPEGPGNRNFTFRTRVRPRN